MSWRKKPLILLLFVHSPQNSNNFFISFLPKAPHKARPNHLPYSSISKPTKIPFLASEEVYHLIGMTQANPTMLKPVFQRALAISQWSKRWFTDSPLFLHAQHQLMTMTCCFLRLSMVRIFSWTANQAKKTAFIGVLIPLNTSPRDISTNVRNKDIVVRFDFKHPSLGRYLTKLV